MGIINFKNLAKNPLRQKALLIAGAGYEAIEIEKIIRQKIKFQNGKLFIKSAMTRHSAEACSKFDLSVYKRVSFIGIGKGSVLASATLAKILGKRLSGGIALDVQSKEVRLPKINRQYSGSRTSQKLEFLTGTHPLPSKQNIKATQKIIKLAKNLKKDDLLITFICGGGSALLCGSEKEMKNSILATKLLTQAGADILELNTVRKHLSEVKGGNLAKLAYPATVVSLIVSDVLGDDLSMIASGPTVYDKTTRKNAEKILKKYFNMGTSDVPNINGDNFRTSDVQKLIRVLAETPKDKKYFKKVKNILFLSNREPVLAMAEKAKKLGLKPKIYSFKLKGEAEKAFLPMIKKVKQGQALIAGGETTVTLRNQELRIRNYGTRKGGRNMESVLGAISNQQSAISNLVIVSFASDGRDNTEAAGAIADALTLQKARKLKLNPQKFLDNHNSFNFFAKTGDLIYTKKNSFNVADLMVVLRYR